MPMSEMQKIDVKVTQNGEVVTAEVSGFTVEQAMAFALSLAPYLQGAIAEAMKGPAVNVFEPDVMCGCPKCTAEREARQPVRH